jgi:Protein of unknown function (DUF4239)
MHIFLVALSIFVGLNAVAVGSVLFSQWKRWQVDLTEYRHYTTVIFNVCGVVYALYLGFVIWDVWDSFDQVRKTVYQEAGTLTSLYRDSVVFGDSSRIHKAIHDYLEHVVEQEWGLMGQRKEFEASDVLVEDIWQAYYAYDPQGPKERIWYAEALDKLNVLSQARMGRMFATRSGVGPLQWFLLLLGGAVLVSIPCFFRVELLAFKLVLTLFLANIVAFMLFITYSLDHPFRGYGRISSYPFEYALQVLVAEGKGL